MNIDGVKGLLEKDKGLSLTLGMEFSQPMILILAKPLCK